MTKLMYAGRPITTHEDIHYLHMYYDLSDEAKEEAFDQYDNEDDAMWHMNNVYDELRYCVERFEDETGCSLSLESVHGPGTEKYLPGENDIYTGWGTLRRFKNANIAEDIYQMDIFDAWNRHISRLSYIYEKMESLQLLENNDLACGTRFIPAMSYSWYEELYVNELDNALQSVCNALNRLEELEEEYTDTREFFEYNHIDTSDNEYWYTSDGKREFVRDTSAIWPVDTCNECDEVFECGIPSVLVVREYVEA